jgi:hypothetical protein
MHFELNVYNLAMPLYVIVALSLSYKKSVEWRLYYKHIVLKK